MEYIARIPNLEYYILILLLPKNIGRPFASFIILLIAFPPLRLLVLLLCRKSVSLLIGLDFLKPVELLSVKFIKLRVDVLDGVLRPRYYNMFNGVDSSIDNLDDFI